MKKLVRSVLMLSMASIAILSSCKKDDNAEVTDVKVEITSTPANPVLINSVVTLNITATGNPDNNLVSISVTRDDGTTSKAVLSKSLSGTSQTIEVKDTLGAATAYTYTVAVEGKHGSPATKTYVVSTKQPAGEVDITPTSIPLFGQTFTSGGAHFMKATDQFVVFTNETQSTNLASIDVVYYYGGSKHTITSADDAAMQSQIYKAGTTYNWTGAKKTLFSRTTHTAAEFDAYEQGDSDEELSMEGQSVNTWASSVKDLQKGEILIYKTAAGKYGYIKIDATVGTGGADAQIDLKFVAQQN
jgi:hypothetical protein